MQEQLHYYLSPLIFPVLRPESGRLVVNFQFSNALRTLADEESSARIEIDVRRFAHGGEISRESCEVTITHGVADRPYLEWTVEPGDLGYVEISFTADRPFFRKIYTEHANGIVERPDGGNFNLNPMFKFSDPAIVEMMRHVGEFCLVHPGQFVSRERNIGNSSLIVNPFDGPITARLKRGDGKELRKRIPPRTTELVPLAELLDDGKWSCVRFTGNNRYPAWDVRHAYDDPDDINRIDHMEYYRGDLTVRRMAPYDFLKSKARRTLRHLGLRT